MNKIKDNMNPIHPGEMLREEFMKPLNLSSNQLAKSLGVTASRINDIVLERRGITPDTGLKLAYYFKTSVELWLNFQQSYDIEVARKSVDLSHITPHHQKSGFGELSL